MTTPSLPPKSGPGTRFRKISETLLDFAQPVLAKLPPGVTPLMMKDALMIPVAVWNAVAMTAWGEDHDHLSELRARIVDGAGPRRRRLLRLLDQLVARKRRHFADDVRAIGDLRVSPGVGELRVRVEARLPRELWPR